MKNIAVFFGGVSCESEVSIITGVLTANTIDKEKFNVVPVYVDGNGEWLSGEYLLDPDNYKNLDYKRVKRVTLVDGENKLFYVCRKKLKLYCEISCAINCMHGERGEDGSLFGTLNMCGIPLASPPLLPSAVSMDKKITKTLLKGLKIPTLPCVTVNSAEKIVQPLPFSFPIIVKPLYGGSSIGVNKANNIKELESAVNYALRFGEFAELEPCLKDFTEINCATYRGKSGVVVSECEKPIGKNEVLTFFDKYESGFREFPAKIDARISKKIKKISQKVYDELNFSGIIRIDFFVKDEKVILNEINAVPGSLAYYLFCKNLKEFSKVLTEIIELALVGKTRRDSVQKSFSSGILSAVGSKSAKRL